VHVHVSARAGGRARRLAGNDSLTSP
jgi:hypothetical protein